MKTHALVLTFTLLAAATLAGCVTNVPGAQMDDAVAGETDDPTRAGFRPAASSGSSTGGDRAYLQTLELDKSGVVKGDGVQKGREGWISLESFAYNVESPRDAASGLATGKRQHNPITVTMKPGSQTAPLYNALVRNEVVEKAVFVFVSPNKVGASSSSGAEIEVLRYTIRNAAVVDYQEVFVNGVLLEKVSFVFQTVEIEHLPSKKMAQDDWVSPVS